MSKKKCLWCGAVNDSTALDCVACGEDDFSAWGGKREGAGSGGARSGAGRKPSTLKVKIPPEQIEFLKAEAERLNVSLDETVTRIVTEYIDKNQP